MPADGSISHWIRLAREGDRASAQPLWERYFVQLEALARKKLRGHAPRGADAEDVALSAMDSLFRGLERGRFPLLRDRDNLWRLLVVITARKAARLKRDENCQKRGGGLVYECGFGPDAPELAEIIGHEPTPELAAQVAEETERMLAALQRPDLRQVALLKLEGCTIAEISQQLGFAPRSVDRKLQLIREIWEKEAAP